jgi:hypothetical protein
MVEMTGLFNADEAASFDIAYTINLYCGEGHNSFAQGCLSNYSASRQGSPHGSHFATI